MLTLDNFEQEIDPEILERGHGYYKTGQVRELEEQASGVWQAVVVGSEDYDVTIEQSEDGLLTECTCPYEWGPYCKHVAAVLYAIRAVSKGEKPRQTETKQQRESAQAILERLPREELLKILIAQIKKDKALGDHIILQYSQGEPDKTTYLRMVQNSLRAGQDRDGFIDYGSTRRATKGIWDLLAKVTELLAEGQARKAIPVLQAIIEGTVPMLQNADDSNGEIGGCVEEAFNRLDDAVPRLEEDTRRALLDYCLAEAFQPKYQGWDYHWSFLHIAALSVKTSEERPRAFAAFDRMAAKHTHDSFIRDFDAEHALQLKLQVMERLDSTTDFHAILLEHKHLDFARQKLVEMYIAQGQLPAASQLCLEAIEMYKRDKPGLVSQYQRHLLTIAEKEGRTDSIVQLAETLLMDARDFDQHYATLKRAVPKEKWAEFVEDLIRRIQAKPIRAWGGQNYLLGEIYAREAQWNRLMNLAQQAPGEVLNRHRAVLEEHCPDKVCVLYEQIIHSSMARASNRDQYREIAHLLRRIQGLEEPERAETIAEALRARYPKRRAMIEELDEF